MIKLRGHHLLCMLTYKGMGYTPAFIERFDDIVARLNQGETIEIITGPDDLCTALDTPCPAAHWTSSCCSADTKNRDDHAIRLITEQLGIILREGSFFSPDTKTIKRLREAFTRGTLRPACTDCNWASICTDIAATGYNATRLTPSTHPPSENTTSLQIHIDIKNKDTL